MGSFGDEDLVSVGTTTVYIIVYWIWILLNFWTYKLEDLIISDLVVPAIWLGVVFLISQLVLYFVLAEKDDIFTSPGIMIALTTSIWLFMVFPNTIITNMVLSDLIIIVVLSSIIGILMSIVYGLLVRFLLKI